MFLTLEEFLAHFPPIQISRNQFIQKLTVMYSKPLTLAQIFSLNPITMKHDGKTIQRAPIIKSADDLRYKNREKVIDYFYEIVVQKRHHYLTRFYKSFFEFKSPDKLKWSGVDIRMPAQKIQLDQNPKSFWKTEDELAKDNSSNVSNGSDGAGDLSNSPHLSLQKNDQSRIMIRNLFYMELLHLTRITNTIKSKTSFWQSLDNLYNHLKLEDRFFAPSSIGLFLREKKTQKNKILKEINYNNLFYLFQAYQPKASILNPYTIKWILENIFAGQRLFTPVLSWSSHLTGFMHCPGYDHYLGVDVMPSVCEKARFLADYYRTLGPQFSEGKKQVEILCTPSEDLAEDDDFLDDYHEFFDSILICPPYFGMEVYHEGEQSLERYPDYQDWLEGYWRPTVEACHHVCQSGGGKFGVIVNDYYDLRKKFYPLTTDLDKITTEYFKPERVYYLHNRTSPLRANSKTRTERLFLYTKQ